MRLKERISVCLNIGSQRQDGFFALGILAVLINFPLLDSSAGLSKNKQINKTKNRIINILLNKQNK